MKTFFRLTLAAALLVGLTAVNAAAQATQSASVTVNATVSSKAKLTIDAAAVAFADADPDVTAILTAAPVLGITVKSRTSAGSTATLAVKADGDLTSGGDTIAIDQLTWTVTGAGFAAGTMATSDVGLGSFDNSGNFGGTQTYQLVNSWGYATGAYSATITYTLTVP